MDLAGKRVARRKTRYPVRGRREAGRRTAAGGGDRALARLVVCGALFVALVAVKLLFPQALDGLARSVGQWMGRDADFREAFAAVGRAMSGEADVEDSLREAYTAVFSPDAVRAERTSAAGGAQGERDYYFRSLPVELPLPVPQLPVPGDGDPGGREEPPALGTRSAEEPPRSGGGETSQSGETDEPEKTGEQATEQPAQASAAQLVEVQDTRVYSMAALPENASLELRTLGFAYCTPLLGKLTSTFGWRDHPVSGGNKFHYGVDLAAETGAAIGAFADGEVYATGESSALGNYIMLRHDGGYVTLYAHCSRVTKTGGSVKMGEKIAEVGETGTATGPHLHFELHDGSLYLNPIYYVQVL